MYRLSGKAYEIIKWIVVIFLPALVGFIYALGEALGFDAVTICKVITAVQIFLGALIGVSTVAYNKNKENNDGTDESKV